MIKKIRGSRNRRIEGRKGEERGYGCGLFKVMYAYCKKEDKLNVRVKVA